MTTTIGTWASRADAAQQTLADLFWRTDLSMFSSQTPRQPDPGKERFNYWWQAHGVDVLVDGLVRTGAPQYRQRLAEIYQGLVARVGTDLINEWYDDMEWMALAFLRASDATGEAAYKRAVMTLWADIKTGWNDEQGGGIAWRKPQLDYKNTPANAPAVILGARLYQRFGNADDLTWAKRIYDWQKANLVDPETGFVWDGKNRTGDGRVDKDWEFTYCQGVFIGAGVELYRVTGDQSYLRDAARTVAAARAKLTRPETGTLRSEGDGDMAGDVGLFKGILMRYLGELVAADPSQTDAIQLIGCNGEQLWNEGKAEGRALFGVDWAHKPGEAVSLSVNLSGVMLVEQMALLEQNGRLK
jgi:predicted alpha-1,6-mannanase (GH76 family)